MWLTATPEDIHIQLIRARDAVTSENEQIDLDYARGVKDTLEWILNDGKQPLTSECRFF